MFLLIDNYDSFTYNLVHAFQAQGVNPVVMRNDDATLLDHATNPELKAVCISPGPSTPDKAGLCLDFLARLPKKIPVLGVCLGHQILGRFAGATVEVNEQIMHGKQSEAIHDGTGLFSGLPKPMAVGRYHSLIVREDSCPDFVTITARTKKGEVMALEYKDRPWTGVQFHPESILTPQGVELIGNFAAHFTSKSPKTPKYNTIPLQVSAVIETLAKGESLSRDEARQTFDRLMDGDLSPAQAGALLLGLRAKGETSIELQSAAEAILERAVPIPGLETISAPIIDVVGTGGDSKFSFNCSTAAALTLAAMGHCVLKHGNRSVSSKCGSADVLEKLGIPLDIKPQDIAAELKKNNFAFLFAVNMHPSFKHIMPVRRELGVRTLFNILGPLTNPGRPAHRLIGVAREDMIELLAGALANMGVKKSAVVFGSGGYDELTPIGPGKVAFIEDSKVELAELEPLDFGFTRCTQAELAISGPDEASIVLHELLTGKAPKPMADMLAFNVGLGLYLLKPDQSLNSCMQEAKQAVASGAARRFINA